MGYSLLDQLARMSTDTRLAYLEALSEDELAVLEAREWSVRARPEQFPPGGTWMLWFVRAGRGWGKTDTAANWTRDRIAELTPHVPDGKVRWFMGGPTRGDVKKIMFEGETGLQSVLPPSVLLNGSWELSFNRSELELRLSTGAIITGFSSETPDRARGPQHHGGWVDEPATFKDASQGLGEDTLMSNLLLGLRLDPDPRMVATGTPKNNRLIKELRKLPGVVETHGRTRDNLHNLSPAFKANIISRYQGTRLGRQELDAEILDDLGNVLQPAWFQRRDRPPWPPGTDIITERYWDLASGVVTDTSPNPDYTVGAKVDFDPSRRLYFIDHIARFRKVPGEREIEMGRIAIMDRLPHVWIEREPGNAGKVQMQTVGSELERYGVAVRGNPATGNKVVRAEVLASAAEQARVYIRDADWVQDFLDEAEEFPFGGHDDQVDAVAGAMAMLQTPGELQGSAGYLWG